jgi:sphingomyelin phosphodiesterase acid-like 3
VIIAMHIPPGENSYNGERFWKKETRFLNLIEAYHSNIIGLFAAHTHHDEIKIIRNKQKIPIAGLFISPALSTSHGNRPALRTYQFEQTHQTWQLVDYTTFVFNKHKQITLKPLYRFSDYYCSHQIRPLLDCLPKVTAKKMAVYLKTGNPNQNADVKTPESIFVE